LTPSALERCSDPDDWLRREIEAALDTRRNIVPLTLDGFDFGTPSIASRLTGKLVVLKKYNALKIPSEFFFDGMAKLRDKYLNVPLDVVRHPASLTAREVAKNQQAAVRSAVGRLRDRFLNVPLDRVQHPAPPAVRQAAKDRRAAVQKDLRNSLTFPVHLPLTLQTAVKEYHAKTIDISAGGILFHTDAPLQVDSLVEFTMEAGRCAGGGPSRADQVPRPGRTVFRGSDRTERCGCHR
jgi:PilZ domain